MGEEAAVREQRRQRSQSCRHHWIIETPHGATSRGSCKRCGASKRFPNAAEDIFWQSRGLGRWSAGRGIARPAEVRLRGAAAKEH